jgi:hypothetical protein
MNPMPGIQMLTELHAKKTMTNEDLESRIETATDQFEAVNLGMAHKLSKGNLTRADVDNWCIAADRLVKLCESDPLGGWDKQIALLRDGFLLLKQGTP